MFTGKSARIMAGEGWTPVQPSPHPVRLNRSVRAARVFCCQPYLGRQWTKYALKVSLVKKITNLNLPVFCATARLGLRFFQAHIF